MTTHDSSKLNQDTFWQKAKRPSFWAYVVFWFWNIIFLMFVSFGFAPIIMIDLVDAVTEGLLPWFFVLFGVILIAIPIITIIFGLTILKNDPLKLVTLGYGVEGPLMIILAIRFFAIGQANWAITFVLIVAALGFGGLLWHLIDDQSGAHTGWMAYVHTVGMAFLVAIGLYGSIWALFYAVGLSGIMVDVVWDFFADLPNVLSSWWRNLQYAWEDGVAWLMFALFGFPLYLLTFILFILLPVMVPFLYARAWWKSTAAINRGHAFGITAGILAACFGLFVLSNQQPQAAAFELVQQEATSIEEAVAKLDREGLIRRGLLNSYLAGTRYTSSNGEVFHIRELYIEAFSMNRVDPTRALQIQSAYEAVAQPLLYKPVSASQGYNNRWQQDLQALRREPQEAAELYEAFFDEPIIEGERDAVVRAVRTTFDPTRATEAWQAVDDREVLLAEQDLTVQVEGDWAQMELHEAYLNQTFIEQEVVYYFTLPESAVVTGLWLGNSPTKEFAYRVSPRGAAQAVYRNEVRRNVDPALLEQIGTRQYRLRIFPIEPPNNNWDSATNTLIEEEPVPLHVWMEFRVMQQDGEFPLPRLSELRNVYWDSSSVRFMNGEGYRDEAWLPDSIPAPNAVPSAHLVEFPDGRAVTARPMTQAELFSAETGGTVNRPDSLAIILDRSRSMADRADDVGDAIELLRLIDPNADVYLTASDVRGEPPSVIDLTDFLEDDVIYYGGQNAAELIQQYHTLNTTEITYDAIFVLTDDSSYSLSDEELTLAVPTAPVWMIHLGGEFPDGYDDETLQAIQASGGGSADSVEEALARVSIGRDGAVDLVDGYRWEVHDQRPSGEYIEHLPTDPFAAFAARRLILAEMIARKADVSDLGVLDRLHAIAIEHSLVTPYSSMIVLVTDRQQQLLDDLENDPDRFEREFEDVGETEGVPVVTGVPEPEEWLLIILAIGMLGWYFWQPRQKRQSFQL